MVFLKAPANCASDTHQVLTMFHSVFKQFLFTQWNQSFLTLASKATKIEANTCKSKCSPPASRCRALHQTSGAMKQRRCQFFHAIRSTSKWDILKVKVNLSKLFKVIWTNNQIRHAHLFLSSWAPCTKWWFEGQTCHGSLGFALSEFVKHQEISFQSPVLKASFSILWTKNVKIWKIWLWKHAGSTILVALACSCYTSNANLQLWSRTSMETNWKWFYAGKLDKQVEKARATVYRDPTKLWNMKCNENQAGSWSCVNLCHLKVGYSKKIVRKNIDKTSFWAAEK